MTVSASPIVRGTAGDTSAHAGRRPRRLTLERLAIYIFLVMVLIYILTPTYIMLVTSLKPINEVYDGTMLALPQHPTLDPYFEAWLNACTGAVCRGMSPGFMNSVKITIPGTILMIALGAINGYVLSFWRVKWANVFLVGMVIGAFLPYQIMIYPLIQIMSKLGIHSTILAAILVHTIYHMPVLTLIFRNYFIGIPIDLFKAARIDGAGFWMILWYIIVPMSLPIIMVAVILSVTWLWNDFLVGLTFAGQQNYPMTVQLNNIIGSDTGAKFYNVEMAAVFLTSVVPLAIYFLAGRWFIRGITSGGLKG